ncbi:hypothetical protein OF83DRAFT_1175017 [Amylostereum chailletii]|nr:hypothetical protein OF83DRAFT_1175017 [Amylostereum chailletii]
MTHAYMGGFRPLVASHWTLANTLLRRSAPKLSVIKLYASMEHVNAPSHAPSLSSPSRPDPYANSPLRNIPPEIKLHIFSNLQDELEDSDQPALVNNSPDMWATLPLRNQDGLQAAIQHSRDRCLSCHAFPPNVPPSGINAHKALLDEVWNHIHRLQRLAIGANEDTTAYLERAAAPNIIELNVCGGIITAQAFHGEIPSNLRVLKLKECSIANTSPVFGSPQLSDVTFIQCRSPLSQDTQSVFAKTLVRVQSTVKNVNVENCSLGFVERADDEADPVPIFLPNVESFRVVDRLDVLGPLLASVIVHRYAKVDIVAYLPDETDSPAAYIEPFEQVNAWVQSSFAGRTRGAMDALAIRAAAGGGTTFTFPQTPQTPRFQQAPTGEIGADSAEFTFTARFVMPAGPDTTAADEDDDGGPEHEEVELVSAGASVVIGGVVVYAATGMGDSDWSATSSTIDVPHVAAQKDDVDWLKRTFGGNLSFVDQVRKLEVEHRVFYTDAGWATIALYCAYVQEVTVVGPAAYGLATLLGKVTGKDAFPGLRTLSIERVAFARRKQIWGRGVTFAQRLVRGLGLRAPASVHISVRECAVEAGAIEHLRASPSVFAVEWDGATI